MVFSYWNYNRLKYIEQEIAKKRGRELGIVEEEVKAPEDDLYVIPEHLKVCSALDLNATFLMALIGFLCLPFQKISPIDEYRNGHA